MLPVLPIALSASPDRTADAGDAALATVTARVSLKPGGQVCVYVALDGTLVFALPGNPGSALTAFRLLVVPALYAFQGRSYTQNTVRGIAAADLPGTIGRATVVRCTAVSRVRSSSPWVTDGASPWTPCPTSRCWWRCG